MAKRFEETVGIQPQSLQTGFVSGANTLLQRLQGFGQATEALVETVETRRGREEAAQAELETKEIEGFEVTAKPETKEPGFFETVLTGGARTKQYNRSMREAYLSSLGNDTREAIAKIEAENPDNITQFNDKVAGYANGVIQETDPVVRQQVTQFLDNTITDARIRVRNNAMARQMEIANAERTKAIDIGTSAAIRAVRDGNQVAAGEALLDLKRTMDSFVGQPGVDQFAVDTAFEAIQKQVATEAIRSRVRDGVQRPGGIGQTAKEVREFRERPLRGFTVAEQEDLYNTLVTDLNQAISLKNREESAEDDFRKTNQQAESESLYLGIVTGTASAGEVTQALASKQITQQQAATLFTVINNTGGGIDDWTLINSIESEIRQGIAPEQIRQTIASNTGSRLTAATGRELLAKVNEYQDQESPLTTSVAQRAEDFIVSSMRVTGPLGSLDTEAERRLATARREYAERVLSGEDPFEVADSLVDRDTFSRAPRPMFGTKDDLDQSLSKLNEAMKAGTLDDDTYNREFQNIETLMQLRDNLKAFDAAKKENLNVRQ